MKRPKFLLNADRLGSMRNKISDGILSRWDKTIVAKSDDKTPSIDIFDVIGSDFFGEGFTAKRMSAALRSIGDDKDVIVNLNSPGGDVYEGATIYNLLAQHKGNVTVNILGIAASVASSIAMAGDKIKIAKNGFLMIHNAWSIVLGNKEELRDFADVLEKFDQGLIDTYVGRSGLDEKKVSKMMGDETWITADEAIEYGMADEIIDVKHGDKKDTDKQSKAQAKRTLEMALAREGFSRKERDEIFQRAGVREAAEPIQRDADSEKWDALIQSMKN